jgi:hypothetical protein
VGVVADGLKRVRACEMFHRRIIRERRG